MRDPHASAALRRGDDVLGGARHARPLRGEHDALAWTVDPLVARVLGLTPPAGSERRTVVPARVAQPG